MLPLEQLQFDATNPRIVERLGPRPGQRQIYNLLVNEEDARDLIPSFIENGYLPTDPLIVRAEHNGKYSVLEGNRRLAALQSMSASEDEEDRTAFEQKNLNELPCLIFRGGEDAELAYLGLRHISKTKDWSPAAKSAFVERLLRSGVSLTQAGRRTNTSPQALRQLLLTRRLFEKAVGLGIETPSIAAERDLVFWHLGDAVRRRRTKQYLEVEENDNPLLPPEVDEGKLEKLMTWIYGNPKTKQTKLITSIRDIPSLDLSLGNEKSIQALEAGATIQDALEAAEAAGAKVNAHLDRAKTSVQKATGTLSDIQRETFAEIDAARMSLTVAFEAFDRELAAARQRLGA
jgi:ParB-like chromosome segregation protein Spo0J